MTSLHQIYLALQDGSLRHANPQAAIAALDVVSHFHGLPLAMLDLDAPKFALAFPRDQVPDFAQPVFGREVPRYRQFRNTVLDCQMLADPGDVDGSGWFSLQRLARLCLGDTARALSGVTSVIPRGTEPGDLDRDLALSTERTLDGRPRSAFRHGLSLIDRLHDFDLARKSGLLPAERIGRLPTRKDHAGLEPLPITLRALRDASPRSTQNAIDFLWRLAVAAGVFPRGDDPSLEAFAQRLPELARLDPACHGLALSGRTLNGYYQRLVRVLVSAGCPDPRVSPPRASWRRLHKAAAAAGVNPAELYPVSSRAVRDGLGPGEVTPAWFAQTCAMLDSTGSSLFNRGAVAFDGLRGDSGIPPELLPAEPSGMRRARRRRGTPAPPPAPRPAKELDSWVEAWVQLFAAARAEGFDNASLHPLYRLRAQAIRARLAPRDLTVDWIVDLLEQDSAGLSSAIYASTRLLDSFAGHARLRDLVQPEKLAAEVYARRHDRRPLSRPLEAALEETLDLMGARGSYRREAAAALKALVEVSGTYSNLDKLLRRRFDAFDWSPFGDREKAYILVLTRLRDFRNLPWSDNWRALQRTVVGAGVPMAENPVPRLLPYAERLEPSELDASWARETDRRLRSTVLNPPHGRADLAGTFANNIRRLDRLHAIAEVAASGLLPPRIGTYRA
ncbi:hypothetical protein ACRDNQ_02270 [Palleronia sp. KMU-117]|uniref:hypothetical protein n=1 Tax=Palleronia sp. KMU-117 TaxID=3434108 RepID=UPI003D7132BC